MSMLSLCCLVVVALIPLVVGQTLTSHYETIYFYSRVSETRTTYTGCGWFWQRRCARHRVVYVNRRLTKRGCQSGYEGPACNIPICSPTCQNNGVCVDVNKCDCTGSYGGSYCEEPCSPICQNGKCVPGNKCDCPSSYGGPRCEVAICSPICQNNGECVDVNTCHCTDNYMGSHCEELKPVCSPICQNDGKCVPGNKCDCPSSYGGSRCEDQFIGYTILDENANAAPITILPGTGDEIMKTAVCSPICRNNGVCVPGNKCDCTGSYGGSRCEDLIEERPVQDSGEQ